MKFEHQNQDDTLKITKQKNIDETLKTIVKKLIENTPTLECKKNES